MISSNGTASYNGTDPVRFNRNLKNVPVIASFSIDGKILPLYFEYEGERFKIANLKKRAQMASFHNFDCEIMVGELDDAMVKPVRHTYNTSTTQWFLEL